MDVHRGASGHGENQNEPTRESETERSLKGVAKEEMVK